MRHGNSKVWLPMGLGCVLVVVAFIGFHFTSNLFGAPVTSAPVTTEAASPTGHTLVDRKKAQLLKRWQKIQRILGVNPESSSLEPSESPRSP